MTFGGVALGCGNFGGVGSAPAFFGQGIDEETALEIMDTAWEGGIHWLDTGDAYGGGRSEQFIGRWLRERHPTGSGASSRAASSASASTASTSTWHTSPMTRCRWRARSRPSRRFATKG